jgi:hypothetical protein
MQPGRACVGRRRGTPHAVAWPMLAPSASASVEPPSTDESVVVHRPVNEQREKGEAMQFGVFTTDQRKLSLIEWSSGAQAVG